MIICLDLRALQIGHENRGIGMYIKSVLEHLPSGDNQYIFYAFDKDNPIEKLSINLKINDYDLVQTPTIKTTLDSPRDIWRLFRLINHSFRLLKKHRPDVFIQFDFTLGIPRWQKTKKIVIGYDLIPLLMKSHYLPSISIALHQYGTARTRSLRNLIRSVIYRLAHLSFLPTKRASVMKARFRVVARSVYYQLKYRLHYGTYKRADHIICISKATLECFIELLGIDKSKLTAIPLAPVLSNVIPDDTLGKKINKPYLFYVGGTDTRKRIIDIVRAFNIARGRGVDIALVLAGNEFREVNKIPDVAGRNAILTSPYKNDIHLVGFVSDAQKLGLYQSAYAFIFCSAFEGFGLPIIEAMSASCPVISYNNSSIPEAAGNAALLVETGDYVAVANQIVALRDDNLRKELINKGLKQVKKFGWQTYSREFMKVINT